MQYVNHNGLICPANAMLFGPDNRVFRYGDGLFESIRVSEGKVCLLDRHLRRLKKGMRLLGYSIPDHYQEDFFQREIAKLTHEQGNHRLRMSIYREDGGFYAPKSDMPAYLLQSAPMDQAQFEFNEKGLRLGLYDEMRLPLHPLSAIKSCNSLPYVLAGRFLRNQEFDECLLLNQEGRVAECSIGNVFIIKNQQLITPPISEGCIEGVMIGFVLELAEQLGLAIWQRAISLEELASATEIGVTNAIRGIRWVAQFGTHRFENHYCRRLLKLLNEQS